MSNDRQRYHRHRFPPEIISHAVWLYHRFGLSLRDVEDLLAERGITVSYEAHRALREQPSRGLASATRQRERQLRRFKSAGQAQRFLSVHSVVRNLFNLGRHRLRAGNYRLLRGRAFAIWTEVVAA